MPTKSLLPFAMGASLINNFRYKFCGRNIVFFHRFFPRHIALNSFDTRSIVRSTSATAVLCYLTVVRSPAGWYLIRIISGKSLQKCNQFPSLLFWIFHRILCADLKYREFSSSFHHVLINLYILRSDIHDIRSKTLAVGGSSALTLILCNRTVTYLPQNTKYWQNHTVPRTVWKVKV